MENFEKVTAVVPVPQPH